MPRDADLKRLLLGMTGFGIFDTLRQNGLNKKYAEPVCQLLLSLKHILDGTVDEVPRPGPLKPRSVAPGEDMPKIIQPFPAVPDFAGVRPENIPTTQIFEAKIGEATIVSDEHPISDRQSKEFPVTAGDEDIVVDLSLRYKTDAGKVSTPSTGKTTVPKKPAPPPPPEPEPPAPPAPLDPAIVTPDEDPAPAPAPVVEAPVVPAEPVAPPVVETPVVIEEVKPEPVAETPAAPAEPVTPAAETPAETPDAPAVEQPAAPAAPVEPSPSAEAPVAPAETPAQEAPATPAAS